MFTCDGMNAVETSITTKMKFRPRNFVRFCAHAVWNLYVFRVFGTHTVRDKGLGMYIWWGQISKKYGRTFLLASGDSYMTGMLISSSTSSSTSCNNLLLGCSKSAKQVVYTRPGSSAHRCSICPIRPRQGCAMSNKNLAIPAYCCPMIRKITVWTSKNTVSLYSE